MTNDRHNRQVHHLGNCKCSFESILQFALAAYYTLNSIYFGSRLLRGQRLHIRFKLPDLAGGNVISRPVQEPPKAPLLSGSVAWKFLWEGWTHSRFILRFDAAGRDDCERPAVSATNWISVWKCRGGEGREWSTFIQQPTHEQDYESNERSPTLWQW